MAAQSSKLENREGVPVLSFSDAVLPVLDLQHETLSLQTDFYPGEFVIIHSEDDHYEDPLVHAISGLLAPTSGIVAFHDRDWQSLEPDQANALRGRIGIVFRNDSWIPYWSVMDNMMLPHLHHTHRPAEGSTGMCPISPAMPVVPR